MGDVKNKRTIAVPLVDRANYGRMKPVLKAIQDHPDLELQVICTGSMVLERFKVPVEEVRKDGFPVDSVIYLEIEGSIPTTMAKSTGLGIIEFASELQRLNPDLLLVVGDRYEMLAAVIAASFINICIAHVQGGEVSGSIDESIRHVITKFSHYHFPATDRSARFITSMGEDPATVFMVGCPSSDIAIANHAADLTNEMINATGSGAPLDLSQPYILVIYHPITTFFGTESAKVKEVLHALDQLRLQTLWLWPNIDAGADHISRELRLFKDHRQPTWLRFAKNFTPEVYAQILARATVAVGNSSSFVRESGFFGTPVVLLGNRQEGREFADNVTVVPEERGAIVATIKEKLQNGRYPPSFLYGCGQVAPAIAAKLAEVPLYQQKHLHYIAAKNDE
jgi:UDP-hydrolysing UDP-N-acetyl-D-glucosamine 2-epimerase